MASSLSRVVLGAGIAVALMHRGPTDAEAQPRPDAPPAAASDKDKETAKKLVAAGIAAQEAEQYDTAIELYKRAYALVPHPILLFNVGQAHRLADRPDQAAVFYRRYLVVDPQGTQAAAARAALATIEARDPKRTPPPSDAPREADAPGARTEEDGLEKQASAEEREPEAGIERAALEAARMRSPAERAVDVVAGVSFMGRRFNFDYDAQQLTAPIFSYERDTPAPGLYVAATVFPLALGHEHSSALRHLGVTLMYDRAFSFSSSSPTDAMERRSTAHRYALGISFRYPLGSGSTAPVIGATLRHGRQEFDIHDNGDIPNVHYELIDFSGFLHYTIVPKLIVNLSAAVLLPRDAGALTLRVHYGQAASWGLEGRLGVDYVLTKNLFARSELRLETIGHAFLGEGMKSSGIESARDTYFGGVLALGYML